MPYVEFPETDGEKLFYTVSRGAGDVPPLLLIHGAGGCRLVWPAGLRRMGGYTLDLPGHGRSSGRGRSDIGDYARVVAGFLRAVGVERAVVAGHSMGGAIALTLGLDYPDRVAGLALIATGARLRVAPAILEMIPRDFAASVALMTRFSWSAGAAPAMLKQGEEMLLAAGPDVLLNDLLACNRFDVMERLGEIKAPTLVIAGAEDQLTPVKYARFLAERVPAAELVVIEGAGHMVMVERSAEVETAARRFLRRC